MLNKRILVLIFVVAFTFGGCFPAPTPPNEVPIITSTPITTATVGVLYTYNVNATDPDGNTLAYSLVVKPSGMTINSATGLIKWTPTAKGDYPVTVKVSDGTLSINQNFTIKVKAVNHAPIITSIPITTATVGVTYLYDVNATDPDNDVLTYSLTTKPNGMVINPVNGLISWVPTSVQTGYNWVVIVSVSDGTLNDFQGFNILVTGLPAINQPPVINSTPSLTATVGVKYTYTITATDPEEDVLTYSLTTKPSGMAIDPATGVISWKPTFAQVGNNPVAVVVSDGDLSVGQNFTIKVSKPSPTPIKYYTITATAGDNGTIDPLGKVKVMEGLDKTFIITPDTSYYIADVLVDGVSVGAVPSYKFNNIRKNHTINATFEVTYIPNHAPIITSIPKTTAIVGENYIYNIIATDPDGDTLKS